MMSAEFSGWERRGWVFVAWCVGISLGLALVGFGLSVIDWLGGVQ